MDGKRKTLIKRNEPRQSVEYVNVVLALALPLSIFPPRPQVAPNAHRLFLKAAVCAVRCVPSEPPNWQMGDDGCRLLRARGPNARRPAKAVGAAGISEGAAEASGTAGERRNWLQPITSLVVI